ncbi:MAG: hypothetical protein KAU20_05235, partial [Nanoarchaeota archaeon]|nr:hypothetical protein [Nanoarchaeota archaeon]
VLEELDCNEVIVITPNRAWLIKQYNKQYQPDPTVVKHYTQGELCEVFNAAGYTVENVGQFGAITENRNERIFIKAKKK